MTNDPDPIVGILVKYALRQRLDEGETVLLEKWRARSPEHWELPEQLKDPVWIEEQRRKSHITPTEDMWVSVSQYVNENLPASVIELPARRTITWRKITVAVAAFAILAGAVLWRPAERPGAAKQASSPAGFRAALQLDDGRMVDLDTVASGSVVFREGNTVLTKADSNSYVYTIAGEASTIRHRFFIAAGGGVCRLQWPNGSRAWLNKGTSLDYAVDLRSGSVSLAGEAWFTIAHDPRRPLTIRTIDGTKVMVMGTSFDIRAVKDSGARVALFSGALRVVRGTDSCMEKPLADSNAVLAWMRPPAKGGYFNFQHADLLTILPKMAQWYRIQVVNPCGLRGGTVTGQLFRNQTLSAMFSELRRVEDKYVRMVLREDTIYVEQLEP